MTYCPLSREGYFLFTMLCKNACFFINIFSVLFTIKIIMKIKVFIAQYDDVINV